MYAEIPNQFLCPISLEIMKDPVICQDGYTYERSFILTLTNSISPMTRQPIDLRMLIPNINLRQMIMEYEEQQKKIIQEQKIEQEKRKQREYEEQIKKEQEEQEKQREYEKQIKKEYEERIKKENYKADKNMLIRFRQSYIEKEREQSLTKNASSVNNTNIREILKNIDMTTQNIINYISDIENNKLDDIMMVYIKPILIQNIEYLDVLYANNNPLSKLLHIFAIFYKKDKVIEWLMNKECFPSDECMELACVIGDKNLIMWLLLNHCKFSIYTFSYSVRLRDVNFLIWLKQIGCFWGCLRNCDREIILSEPNIKKWLELNNCPWNLQ